MIGVMMIETHFHSDDRGCLTLTIVVNRRRKWPWRWIWGEFKPYEIILDSKDTVKLIDQIAGPSYLKGIS